MAHFCEISVKIRRRHISDIYVARDTRRAWVAAVGEDKSFCRWLRLNKDDGMMPTCTSTIPPLFADPVEITLIREVIDK